VPRATAAPLVTSCHAYDVVLDGPGTHRGMPSTSVTFVLPLHDRLDVAWWDAPRTRQRGWSVVSGLHTTPALIRHTGRQAGVQLDVTIAGARALLGVPAGVLARELLTVEDLAGRAPWLRDLPERLADADGWAARSAVVRRVLEQAGRARAAGDGVPPVRAEVDRALVLLERGARVAAVADEVGYSRRRLSTLVRDETGLAPQELARVARLGRSQATLRRQAGAGAVRLADVAAETGYSDHAHLTRDWRDLAGCTPSDWLREEFPIVQAGDAAPVAGWEEDRGPVPEGPDTRRHNDRARTLADPAPA